jgi:hypothetical protein
MGGGNGVGAVLSIAIWQTLDHAVEAQALELVPGVSGARQLLPNGFRRADLRDHLVKAKSAEDQGTP